MMNNKLMLLVAISASVMGAQARVDVLEKAINANDPKRVRAIRNMNENLGIKLSQADKDRYVELAKAQVEKKKECSLQPQWKALLSLEGLTGTASAIMTIGGLALLAHSWSYARKVTKKAGQPDEVSDEWVDTPVKAYGAFILGVGQGLGAIAGAYKNLWQTDKKKETLEKAEKILELVEALPVA